MGTTAYQVCSSSIKKVLSDVEHLCLTPPGSTHWKKTRIISPAPIQRTLAWNNLPLVVSDYYMLGFWAYNRAKCKFQRKEKSGWATVPREPSAKRWNLKKLWIKLECKKGVIGNTDNPGIQQAGKKASCTVQEGVKEKGSRGNLVDSTRFLNWNCTEPNPKAN